MKHWYSHGITCMAVYYSIDDLVFLISLKMRFIEISKTLRETIWTIDNYTSPWALYIDEFGLSDNTPIKIFKKEI